MFILRKNPFFVLLPSIPIVPIYLFTPFGIVQGHCQGHRRTLSQSHVLVYSSASSLPSFTRLVECWTPSLPRICITIMHHPWHCPSISNITTIISILFLRPAQRYHIRAVSSRPPLKCSLSLLWGLFLAPSAGQPQNCPAYDYCNLRLTKLRNRHSSGSWSYGYASSYAYVCHVPQEGCK
jgi:hypothetical protein